VKARAVVALLLFVPLFARAICEEGAVLPAAAPPCHGHASDAEPTTPAPSDLEDCCPACDAFVSAHLSDPVPDSTSLLLPDTASPLAPVAHRPFPVDRPPDDSLRPLSRENPPLLL
jgi:hypothetical protein